MIFYIYALIDPDSNDVHYVGATVEPARRLREILSPSLAKSKRRALWIMELKAQQKEPRMVILETTDHKSWKEVEEKWIAHYENQGAPILNKRRGGGGGIQPQNVWKKLFLLAGLDKVKALLSIQEKATLIESALQRLTQEDRDYFIDILYPFFEDRDNRHSDTFRMFSMAIKPASTQEDEQS